MAVKRIRSMSLWRQYLLLRKMYLRMIMPYWSRSWPLFLKSGSYTSNRLVIVNSLTMRWTLLT